MAGSAIRRSVACFGLIAMVYASGTSAQVLPGAVEPVIPKQIQPEERSVPTFAVPVLVERPLGEDEGPRLVVKAINFEDSVKFPPSPERDAFIRDAIDSAIENQGSGMTIGKIQAVADKITQYYRSQGYMLARAYVPKQDAQDGTVTLKVLAGFLGDVLVEGNERASARVLSSAFDPLLGEVVEQDSLESALLLASDIPGSSIYGVLRPGSEVGASEVVLKVQGEDMVEPYLVFDNYGTDSTGEYRGIAGVNLNNLIGIGDQLNLLVLQTADPEDSLYGSIATEVPVWHARLFAGGEYNYNDYTVSEATLGSGSKLEGYTRRTSGYLKYKWLRSRDANLNTTFGFSRKTAKLKLVNQGSGPNTTDLGRDDLGALDLVISWDSVDSLGSGGVTRAQLSGVFGSQDFPGAMENGDSQLRVGVKSDGSSFFTDSTYQVYGLELLRIQRITDIFSVSARLEGMYSDDLLSSLEQYSVGGPANVRAFPVSQALGDKALFGSVELTASAPGFSDVIAFGDTTWGELLQFSIYYDAVQIEQNYRPEGQDDQFNFMGVGLGIQVRYSDLLYVRFDAAEPDSSSDTEEDSTQYWVSLNFRF